MHFGSYTSERRLQKGRSSGARTRYISPPNAREVFHHNAYLRCILVLSSTVVAAGGLRLGGYILFFETPLFVLSLLVVSGFVVCVSRAQTAVNKITGGFDGGGGFSTMFASPTYQSGHVQAYAKSDAAPPAATFNGSNRYTMHIAAFA